MALEMLVRHFMGKLEQGPHQRGGRVPPWGLFLAQRWFLEISKSPPNSVMNLVGDVAAFHVCAEGRRGNSWQEACLCCPEWFRVRGLGRPCPVHRPLQLPQPTCCVPSCPRAFLEPPRPQHGFASPSQPPSAGLGHPEHPSCPPAPAHHGPRPTRSAGTGS